MRKMFGKERHGSGREKGCTSGRIIAEQFTRRILKTAIIMAFKCQHGATDWYVRRILRMAIITAVKRLFSKSEELAFGI